MSKTIRNTENDRRVQVAYYVLCDRARALGVPTSLDDDPSSPRTVRGLRKAVRRAERLQAVNV